MEAFRVPWVSGVPSIYLHPWFKLFCQLFDIHTNSVVVKFNAEAQRRPFRGYEGATERASGGHSAAYCCALLEIREPL